MGQGGLNSTGSGNRQNLGPCGQDNAISGSLQGGEFFDQLRNSRNLNLDSPVISYVGSLLFGCLVSIVGWLVTGRQADRRSLRSIKILALSPRYAYETLDTRISTNEGLEHMTANCDGFCVYTAVTTAATRQKWQGFMTVTIFTLISQIIRFPN